MRNIKVTETVFRDGQQSLISTKMTTDEMLPILKIMDRVGYHSIEMWGGATFDSCLRYLNEDPWKRLKKFRANINNTKLQMLLRGQNLLAYRHFSDEIVIDFVKKSVANGIDIIRTFDALNDLKNVKTSLLATKVEGAHGQVAIAYTESPVHSVEGFVSLGKQAEEMGADSLCIKDMAGLLRPYTAYELVKELRRNLNIPIEIHSHCSTGLASMTYLKAIEAGADIVDTAVSPLALGTSQPATEALVMTLNGTRNDTEIDMEMLKKVTNYFRGLRVKYLKDGLLSPRVTGMNPDIMTYQIPGGMISNLIYQLKSQNALDKFGKVLKEVERVRADLGYPPLVTPISQMVGTQAVFNVITSLRYGIVSRELKAYIRGMYGRTPSPIKQEIIDKVIGDESPIDYRPADVIESNMEELVHGVGAFMEKEEDLLTYAMYPDSSLKFFSYRQAEKYRTDKNLTDNDEKTYPI